jgi:rRNA-processing protein FCF1
MKVVLDTNALMVPEQFGVKIFSELNRLGYVEYLVPQQVCQELRLLEEKAEKGRDKMAARVGIGLAGQCKIFDVSEVDADSAVEKLAIAEGAAVFTNDKVMKKRLSIKGITVVYLRQGRYLEAMKKEF